MMKKIVSSAFLASVVLSAALPVMAETTPTPTPTATNSNLTQGLACMQTAVGTRDGAIITAWGTFSTAGTTALQTRKDALVSAWGIQDKKERRTQLAKAWSDFKYSARTARRTFNGARDAAWQQFKNDALNCKKQYKAPITDDKGVKGNDVNL